MQENLKSRLYSETTSGKFIQHWFSLELYVVSTFLETGIKTLLRRLAQMVTTLTAVLEAYSSNLSWNTNCPHVFTCL